MTKQVKKRFPTWTLLVATMVAALGTSAIGEAASAPNAQEILRDVRMNQAGQHHVFNGHLRNEGKVVPFRLTLDGSTIRYDFAQPSLGLVLRLGENSSRLEEIVGNSSEKVTDAHFDTLVRDTDISYEDLALRFLYWSKAAVEGEDNINLQSCWKLRLDPAGRDSQYAFVRLWVAKNGGALMRAEGYDSSGKIVKRFEVRSGQRYAGGWILKSMRIEQLDEKHRDKSPTYLEIEKPKD